MPQQLPDEALAVRAKKGDDSAFEELFDRYKERILNFVSRFIGNRETAKEVTQEVFIYVYKNLHVFDPRKKFVSWIFLIARCLAKNSLRDKRYFRDIPLETTVFEGQSAAIKLKDVIMDPRDTPDVALDNEELTEAAEKVINLLPRKYREVMALCINQNFSEKEAAEMLGCGVSTISMRLKKAKTLFLKKLGIRPPKKRG